MGGSIGKKFSVRLRIHAFQLATIILLGISDSGGQRTRQCEAARQCRESRGLPKCETLHWPNQSSLPHLFAKNLNAGRIIQGNASTFCVISSRK